MNVLIYDPLHAGHHLNWVRLMVRAVTPFAGRITFATTNRCARSPEYAQHLRKASSEFLLDPCVDPIDLPGEAFEGLRTARRAWLGLAKAVDRHRPDHVFVPFGDNLVFAPLCTTPRERDLGLSPEQIDGVFIQSAEFAYHQHLRPRRRIRSYAGLMCMHRLPFGRLMFIDSIVHDWLGAHCRSLSRRCVLLPDPVGPVGRYEKSTARTMLGIPTEGRLISCTGVLDARKGVDEFVRSFGAAALGHTDRLLLAGRATPAVGAAVREVAQRIGAGRIIRIDRVLTNQELDLAVSAADLVAATYRFPQHLGSASVLIRAAAAGRPVLSSAHGWLGQMTRAHSLGWVYPDVASDRPASIADSLKHAAGYAPDEKAKQFAESHSVDRWGEILTAPLRRQDAGSTEVRNVNSSGPGVGASPARRPVHGSSGPWSSPVSSSAGATATATNQGDK
jgi:glycosyltransferase involved in cell wall biosynthesis